jgi:hypothetical protein
MFNCACDLNDDCESNEFYDSRWPVARKEHKCIECDSTINKGEKYQYCVGKSDGYLWTAKICKSCSQIGKDFCCGSWPIGELYSIIAEVNGFKPGELLGR